MLEVTGLVLLCDIKVTPDCPVTPEHTRDYFHTLLYIVYGLSTATFVQPEIESLQFTRFLIRLVKIFLFTI